MIIQKIVKKAAKSLPIPANRVSYFGYDMEFLNK